jgi:5-methylcytosine-specific restriction endonuclease McrA
MHDLNYDHVVPRRRGGKTVWENIVMACYDCNGHKGGRTPEEAGMKLLRQPVKPKTLPMSPPILHFGSNVPEEWRPYIGEVAA